MTKLGLTTNPPNTAVAAVKFCLKLLSEMFSKDWATFLKIITGSELLLKIDLDCLKKVRFISPINESLDNGDWFFRVESYIKHESILAFLRSPRVLPNVMAEKLQQEV